MLHVDAGTRKEPGPLPVTPALDKYRAMPGVTIETTALQYNAATDTAITPLGQELVDEDTAWERLKGSEQYRAWRIREKQALELLPRGIVNDLAGNGAMEQQANRHPKRQRSSRRMLLAVQNPRERLQCYTSGCVVTALAMLMALLVCGSLCVGAWSSMTAACRPADRSRKLAETGMASSTCPEVLQST